MNQGSTLEPKAKSTYCGESNGKNMEGEMEGNI